MNKLVLGSVLAIIAAGNASGQCQSWVPSDAESQLPGYMCHAVEDALKALECCGEATENQLIISACADIEQMYQSGKIMETDGGGRLFHAYRTRHAV